MKRLIDNTLRINDLALAVLEAVVDYMSSSFKGEPMLSVPSLQIFAMPLVVVVPALWQGQHQGKQTFGF